MSLDISLTQEKMVHECPECGHKTYEQEELHWQNITHNLNQMADKAGFYEQLWGYDENVTKAKHLIKPLKEGLEKLKSNPDYYKTFDAENGWGTYKDFVPWLETLLDACRANPDADLHFSV